MSSHDDKDEFRLRSKEKAGHIDWLDQQCESALTIKFQDYTFEEWNK